MNTRPLTAYESQNLAILNAAGVESTPLFLTPTGYRKSICDATDLMRGFFVKHGIHNYETQGQGLDNKVFKHVLFLSESGEHPLNMALYRPVTKQGDPRFWVHGWKSFIGADHVLAFFYDVGLPCIINLSTANLASPQIQSRLERIAGQINRASRELLDMLRELAKSPIPASCEGDTAIGRAIESALGIPINSSKNPDYKGIELKSKRAGALVRNTLFACVPDWNLSPVKNFNELLARFGYQRGTDVKLYCTVSALRPNSQGLLLSLQDSEKFLWENSRKNGGNEQLMVWPLAKLEERLVAKHKETFWIKADSTRGAEGNESFLLKSVMHTRNPNIPQFTRLLADGSITVDHLIKRRPSGAVSEKGPLFKLRPNKIPELFLGTPQHYDLSS